MSDQGKQRDRCPRCGAPLAEGAAGGLCPACLLKQGLASNTDGSGPRVPFTPPSIEEIAPRFPGLELIELLGHGGMGAVYKARQKDLDRLVAVKILPPAVSDDPRFAERFAREAKAMARLNHPHIVTIHNSGGEEGLFYFVMEYVDGVSLSQLMRRGRVAPREALSIVPQICDALQYAHDHGIVHRDIKPENILMDRRGNVKVADFGVAKLVETSEAAVTGQVSVEPTVTEPGRVMGTPQYMAPEQREHPQDVDHRADIYALGVVFYQMLTGDLPGSPPPVPPSKKVAVDVRLDEVVLRALEREPARRYGQVSEVKTRVEQISDTSLEKTVPLAASLPTSPARPSRFSRTAFWGALWAGSFLLLPMMLALGMGVSGIGVAELFIILFLFPPGLIALAAPLGSTALGWIAVTQIRNAPDRLHGLGLALFDALFFPLVLLNLVLFVAGVLVGRGLMPYLRPIFGPSVYTLLFWCLTLLTCGAVTILAARRVSRWARRPAASAPPAETGPRRPLVPVLVTLAWHAALFGGVALFFVYFVPGYVKVFADMAIEVPLVTRWAISFSRLVQTLGFFALPLLLLLDAGVCLLLQRWAPRGVRILWSVLVVLVCLLLVVSSAATLYLPFVDTLQRLDTGTEDDVGVGARTGQPVPANVPSSAHVGSAGGTVMVHHRDGVAEYAVYYRGDFSHSGGTQHNTRSLLWYEDFSLLLESGTTFGYTRESVNPHRVRINGREFLLLIGRVFVLHDDGTVEQFPLFPELETARDPEAVGALVAGEETFAPARFVTLNDPATSRARALDLEAGEVLDVPGDLLRPPLADPGLVGWMREHEAHLMAAWQTDHWDVKTVDAVLGPVPGVLFGQVTATQLRAVAMEAHSMSYNGGVSPDNVHLESTVRLRSDDTRVLAFRTVSGVMGVVEFQDAGSASPSLKLLYKRLQAGTSRHDPEEAVSIVLNHLDMPFSNALNLDTGGSLDVPGDLLLSAWTEPRQLGWMRDNGAHVIAAYWTNHWAVKLVDASLMPLPGSAFEKATPSDAKDSIEVVGASYSLHSGTGSLARPEDLSLILSFPTESLAGQIFAFRTGAGAEGVILVEEASSAPPALHLRYRRLQDAAPVVMRLEASDTEGTRCQWRFESPRPARMLYGLVEVRDDGTCKPLLSGVDERMARLDDRTLGLRVEPVEGRWRIHLLDDEHRRMNVSDSTAGPAIHAGAGSGPTDFAASHMGDAVNLSDDAYRVLWQGEITTVATPTVPARSLRRFRLITRTSGSGPLPHMTLGPYDRVDEVRMPPGAGARQGAETRPPGATASLGRASRAEEAPSAGTAAPAPAKPPGDDESRGPISAHQIFDRVIQFREDGSTNAFLDLDTGDLLTPPPDIALAIEERKGQPLQTWGGSSDAMQFANWVRREGVDMWLYGNEGLRVAGGKFVQTHGPDYRTWNDLDSLAPGAGRAALARHSISGSPGTIRYQLVGL